MSDYEISYTRLRFINSKQSKVAIVHILINAEENYGVALVNYGFDKKPATVRYLKNSYTRQIKTDKEMVKFLQAFTDAGYTSESERSEDFGSFAEVHSALTPVVMGNFQKADLEAIFTDQDFTGWRNPPIPEFDMFGNALEGANAEIYRAAAENMKEAARLAAEEERKAAQQKLVSISGFGDF